jgi:hypothetical protein
MEQSAHDLIMPIATLSHWQVGLITVAMGVRQVI